MKYQVKIHKRLPTNTPPASLRYTYKKTPTQPRTDRKRQQISIKPKTGNGFFIEHSTLFLLPHILNGRFPADARSSLAFFDFIFRDATSWKWFSPPKSCFERFTLFLFPQSYSSSLQREARSDDTDLNYL